MATPAKINYDQILEKILLEAKNAKEVADLGEKIDEYCLVKKSSLNSLVMLTNALQHERYLENLRFEIKMNSPVDFDDVWAVLMEQECKKNGKYKDPKKLVARLKKEHPNLFNKNLFNDLNEVEISFEELFGDEND